MNSTTISGKCWETSIKTTQSGMMIFETSVSVYDGKDKDGKAKYLNMTVKAFKEVAEAAGDTLDKGDNILVTGRLSQESWPDKETGKTRYKTVLIADTIAKDTRQFAKKSEPQKPQDAAAQFGQDVGPDEDCPF